MTVETDSDERVARYAEAIHQVSCTPHCVSPVRHASRLTSEARAVMAVADEEYAEYKSVYDFTVAEIKALFEQARAEWDREREALRSEIRDARAEASR